MRPTGNRLLAALPEGEYLKLLPHLELVPLAIGKILAEPGERILHGYFPTTAIISLVTPIEEHGSMEVAVVGSEGMIVVSLALEGVAARGPSRCAVVESAGYAYRMRADLLATEFAGCSEMRQLVLRYTQALITQVAQTVACNRHHTVAQQLCRWLLVRLDRSSGRELQTTQAQIAALLGVRREGVSVAANDLRRAGIICSRRGSIRVLERSELERRACECYAQIAEEYARLLPDWRSRDYPRVIRSFDSPRRLLDSSRTGAHRTSWSDTAILKHVTRGVSYGPSEKKRHERNRNDRQTL